MAAKYIVREREFLQLSRPLAYQNKRVAQFTKWKTLRAFAVYRDACEYRRARNTGLFERVVFYRGTMVVDPEGRQLVCGEGQHGIYCDCKTGATT